MVWLSSLVRLLGSWIFFLRPRQLVHCPAFINKQQGEREFTWRQQRLLLFFFAKSAAPVTTYFPRQFAGKTQHRQLLLTQGSWWILIVCGILINCITSSQWSLYDRVGHFSTGGHGLCEFSLRYVAEHYYTYCSRYNKMSLPSNYNVRVNNCIVTCWSTVNCQQFICLLTMVTTNQCC